MPLFWSHIGFGLIVRVEVGRTKKFLSGFNGHPMKTTTSGHFASGGNENILTCTALTVRILDYLAEIKKRIEEIEAAESPPKKCNVLSFDGGGSRGLMEAIIIDDIMKMATLMKNHPKEVEKIVSEDLSLSNVETLDKLKECFNKRFTEIREKDLHPTDVFDYIAGITMIF